MRYKYLFFCLTRYFTRYNRFIFLIITSLCLGYTALKSRRGDGPLAILSLNLTAPKFESQPHCFKRQRVPAESTNWFNLKLILFFAYVFNQIIKWKKETLQSEQHFVSGSACEERNFDILPWNTVFLDQNVALVLDWSKAIICKASFFDSNHCTTQWRKSANIILLPVLWRVWMGYAASCVCYLEI